MIAVDLRPGPSANLVLAGDVLVDTGSGSPASLARTRALRDGDAIGELEVVHTPGQTPGHVAYWHAGERVAITGDLLQNGDVAWVPFGGPWAEGALDRMIASVKRIAALEPVRTIPGHGPPVDDVPAAVAATLVRYERFRAEPERAVWHAVRRALVSHLMIAPRSAAALAALPWAPIAATALGQSPLAVVERALGALGERGVVMDEGGIFATTLPHELIRARPAVPRRGG